MKISRSELHRRVWAEPLYTLGPKLGVSNVALRKICLRHDVPLPPGGYWFKESEQHRRFRADRTRPHPCDDYRADILRMVETGQTNAAIHSAIQRQGFVGSLWSLKRYVRRITAGKTRHVESGNQHGRFRRVTINPAKARFRVPEPLLGPDYPVSIGEPRLSVHAERMRRLIQKSSGGD